MTSLLPTLSYSTWESPLQPCACLSLGPRLSPGPLHVPVPSTEVLLSKCLHGPAFPVVGISTQMSTSEWASMILILEDSPVLSLPLQHPRLLAIVFLCVDLVCLSPQVFESRHCLFCLLPAASHGRSGGRVNIADWLPGSPRHICSLVVRGCHQLEGPVVPFPVLRGVSKFPGSQEAGDTFLSWARELLSLITCIPMTPQ